MVQQGRQGLDQCQVGILAPAELSAAGLSTGLAEADMSRGALVPCGPPLHSAPDETRTKALGRGVWAAGSEMKAVSVPFYGCSRVLTAKLLSTPGSFKALLEKLCSFFVAFYLSHSEVLQTLPHPSLSAPQAELKSVSCPRSTDGETEAWGRGLCCSETLKLPASLPRPSTHIFPFILLLLFFFSLE